MSVKVSQIQIALMDRTTVKQVGVELEGLAAALQHQVAYHLAPAWDLPQVVHVLPIAANGTPPLGAWQLVLLDSSDVAGALGYHDLTTADQPIGKVFVKTDLAYGADYHITASHELCEMLVDPWINLAAQVSDTEFYAYEVSDACEADQFGYPAPNGMKMSDFVTPAWFIPGSQGPYDYKNHITKPLQILTGGYIGVIDIGGGGWSQITNSGDFQAARGARAPIGSRRERRRVGRSRWIRSTAS